MPSPDFASFPDPRRLVRPTKYLIGHIGRGVARQRPCVVRVNREPVRTSLAPRETVALVGESGCGKSVTVLRCRPQTARLEQLFASTGVTCSRSRRRKCLAFAPPPR